MSLASPIDLPASSTSDHQAALSAGDAARGARYATAVAGLRLPEPDTDMLVEVRDLRDALREEAYGAQQVGEIAAHVEMYWGWPAVRGVYTDGADEAIALHSWNLLPDGAVLDVSADRFGESRDVVVIAPGDPAWSRYRQEWTQDFNPATPGVSPEVAACPWTGTPDMTTILERRAEYGQAPWWLEGQDQTAYRAFQDTLSELRAGYEPEALAAGPR